MKTHNEKQDSLPVSCVDVIESPRRLRAGYIRCQIEEEITFSSDALQSYCFAPWDPLIYDVLLLAASVEFCDKFARRRKTSWGRKICVRIPVHSLSTWNRAEVKGALINALAFLTGDCWEIEFYSRKEAAISPRQQTFALNVERKAVMAFSEGVDSLAVSSLYMEQHGVGSLIRVRVGGSQKSIPKRTPFIATPFKVKPPGRHHEPSVRSRGFKFSIISGVAAHLAGICTVIVPESGQGSLGPALMSLGQIYPDYRNHPAFFKLMQKFLFNLLGRSIEFHIPRIWKTKGETVKDYLSTQQGKANLLTDTRSCWQDGRWVSLDGERRQCGVCAACLLRRLSFHTAGVQEPAATYIWDDLNIDSFEKGALKEIESARLSTMREYAIAGVSHMSDLANSKEQLGHNQALDRHAHEIGAALNLNNDKVRQEIENMISRHAQEWNAFLMSLKPNSYIRRWAGESP